MGASRNSAEHLSRRHIDIAIGTLIGLHRCSEEEALAVLVEVAHATNVGLGAVSRALVSVVGGGAHESLAAVAVDAWADYLSASAPQGREP